MKSNNTFVKLAARQVLTEYGIAMTNSELKLLVEDRIGKVQPERWNQAVQELSEYTGMIIEE